MDGLEPWLEIRALELERREDGGAQPVEAVG